MARLRKYDISIGRKPPFDIFEKRFLNTLTSTVNTNFPRVMKPLPYEMIKTHERFEEASYYDNYGGRWTLLPRTTRSFIGHVTGEPGGPAQESVLLDVRKRAENAFLEDVASVRVNLLDLYRTRIETANMVVKNMHKLVNAYRCLKKGKWRQFQRTLGFTASRPKKNWDNIPALWLEYSYGWAPLINDVYTMLNKPFEAPKMYVRRKYSYQSEKQLTKYVDKPSSGTGCKPYPGPSKVLNICNYVTTYRGVTSGYITVDAPALQAISQYGLNNPTLTVWEAIPFSFVFDWFVPIGNYLEMMGATAGLKFIDCSTTVTLDIKGKTLYHWHQRAGNSTCSVPRGNWKSARRYFEYRRKKRYVSTPTYSFGNLQGPMDQSVTRFSYALSLIANIWSSKAK